MNTRKKWTIFISTCLLLLAAGGTLLLLMPGEADSFDKGPLPDRPNVVTSVPEQGGDRSGPDAPSATEGIPEPSSAAPSVPEQAPTPQPAPPKYEIRGTVVDATWQTPGYQAEIWARLGAAESEEEFEQLGGELDGRPQPAPSAVVTLQGEGVTTKVVSNFQGEFTFRDLASGTYEISAEKAAATAVRKRVKTDARSQGNRVDYVNLELRADLLTIQGRITDINGRPIAGAKVTGKSAPENLSFEAPPEAAYAPQPILSTVSRADGSYELEGIALPEDLRAAAFYLQKEPDARGPYNFCVDVLVEAEGFVQSEENIPRVPRITEDSLRAARRLHETLYQWERRNVKDGEFDLKEERVDLALPAVRGNVITGIDIVLDPVDNCIQ